MVSGGDGGSSAALMLASCDAHRIRRGCPNGGFTPWANEGGGAACSSRLLKVASGATGDTNADGADQSLRRIGTSSLLPRQTLPPSGPDQQ
jgi:hypothetical protein